MSDSPKAGVVGPERSRSPSPKKDEEERGRSRSRSMSRSRSPHHRRSRSRSYSRSRSRSRSPNRRAASPSRGAAAAAAAPADHWKIILERIYDKGTIRRGELEERTITELEGMSDEEAGSVITRLEDIDASRIRNMNGFVAGIIRRVKSDGPDRGEITLESLPRAVREKLQDLVEDRKLEQREVDQRLVVALNGLSDRNAEEALRRFADSVDETIRSRQGFLMGIIKRLRDDERGGGGGGYRGGGGGRRGGGFRGGDRYGGGGGDRYGGGGGGGDRYGGPPPSYGGGDRYGGGGGGGYGGGDRRSSYDDTRYGGGGGGGSRGYGGGGYDDRRY